MNTRPHILVVAPDGELSRSVRFALEVEDYQVTWRNSIGSRPMPGEYDCAIVDNHGLGDDSSAAQRFARAFSPLILLASRPDPISSLAFRTLLKPHLGGPLVEAVRDAIALSGRH